MIEDGQPENRRVAELLQWWTATQPTQLDGNEPGRREGKKPGEPQHLVRQDRPSAEGKDTIPDPVSDI